jgi:uncharacterized protein (DUF2062 family)
LQVIKLFLCRIPITQRHPAFRNNPLQKLQQPILKLVRCPRSLAPTLVTLPSMSLIPFAPFGDVMANEETSAAPGIEANV